MRGGTAGRTVCLVDAHVHLHRVFDVAAFLEHVTRNFTTAAREVGALQAGVLLLAETPGEEAFSRIAAIGSAGSRWSVGETPEPEAIVVSAPGAAPLVVIAGRQLVTQEGVEVLALMSAKDFPNGSPLADTLRLVRQDGAMAVLPWGFGKWTFERGHAVTAVLQSASDVLVGDNAGRWRLLPTPAPFTLARSRRIPILPGSDPLPFRGQVNRAGSYGFVVPQPIDLDRPSRDLRAWLRSQRVQPRPFGHLESAGAFAMNQVRMQWRKRVRPGR